MKDIVITSKTIKREALILLGCFIGGCLLNLGAIIHYHHPALELLSQIGYVIVISVICYMLLWVLRIIVLIAKSIFKRK